MLCGKSLACPSGRIVIILAHCCSATFEMHFHPRLGMAAWHALTVRLHAELKLAPAKPTQSWPGGGAHIGANIPAPEA
jgi:hypothetical protein